MYGMRIKGKRLSQHTSHVEHQAGAYRSFGSMKWLGVFLGYWSITRLALNAMVPIWIPKCLAQGNDTTPHLGLRPGPLDLKSVVTCMTIVLWLRSHMNSGALWHSSCCRATTARTGHQKFCCSFNLQLCDFIFIATQHDVRSEPLALLQDDQRI